MTGGLRRAVARAGLQPIEPSKPVIGRPPGSKDTIGRGELRRACLDIHAASMRGLYRGHMTDTRKIEVSKGLLRLKKQGLIHNVWIDEGVIRVQLSETGFVRKVTWAAAEMLIQNGERE